MVLPEELRVLGSVADYLRSPQRLRRDVEWCGIEPKYCDEILAGAVELLSQRERLGELELTAKAMFSAASWGTDPIRDALRDESLGERFFLIYPLLQRLEELRDWYQVRGIPESVLRHTLYDFQLWIETQHQRTGLSGFREAGWLRNHFLGRVFRLGRLQFEPTMYTYPFVPLVHCKSGEVRIVAKGGAAITAGGVFADSEGATEPFIDLIYEEVAGEVRRGHAVAANGYIEPVPSDFAAGQWRKGLNWGDTVLSLHIPAGEPLDFTACRESFRLAADFFPSYFPGLPVPRAVACGSWLFYQGLCDILPAESNIVRFQKLFYRFPMRSATSSQTYERAFAGYARPIKAEQLKTTLERRLYDHINEDNIPLAACGMILAPFDDFR